MLEEREEKFCGNCVHHNVYEYPEKIFCGIRLLKGLDPIVPTLWHCEHWAPDTQGCFCVQEALKAKKAKENP